MPEMLPVGNTIQPPPPINALQSLSGILGIKQQQQNLQTGQYIQQEQQAGAQQAQQKNQEMQNLAAFTHQAISDPSYQMKDGTPDVGKFQQGAMAVAPTYGQAIIGQTTSNFKEGVETRKALQSLSADQNSQLSGMLKSIASNPNATRSDLMDAIEQQRINNKDPAYNRALDNLLLSSDRTNIPGSAAKAASALGGFTQNTPTTIDKGPAFQGASQNVFTGALNEAGPPVTKALTPSERLPHQATTPAGIVNITPQGAISAPPQAGAAPPGVPSLNPSAAQAATASAAAQGIAQRVQQAKAADYDRPAVLDALSRARAILANPNAPALGSSFELNTYIKNALSSMGVDTGGATNANELVKNLARAEAARSQSSPIGTTDAGRSLLSKGTGSTHIDNAAALNIIDQSIATEMAGRGYLKAVTPFQGDPVKMQSAESRFLSTPHLIHAYELGLKKSPAEVESFKKQNGLSNNDLGAATDHLKALGAL